MRSRNSAQFLSTLYVFAVNDELTANMTDEAYALAQWFGLILKKRSKDGQYLLTNQRLICVMFI